MYDGDLCSKDVRTLKESKKCQSLRHTLFFDTLISVVYSVINSITLIRILCICTVILAVACSAKGQHSEKGLASYYHDSLEGNRTANGEIFSQNNLTAAHRTLPLGTWVIITDLEGHEVVVRVNDRLPANSTRMIDLTTTAARKLKMIEKGLKPVKLRVISNSQAWWWYIRNGYLVHIL